MSDHRIVFTPSGLNGTVETGSTVLAAARRLGVDLDTVCGGRGICGRCQVVPGVGSFPKWGITVAADALSAWTGTEVAYQGRRPLVPGHRLGCAATVCGDVVVDVPPTSQVHRQIVRKDLDLAPTTVDPSFTLWYVEVVQPELGDDASLADIVRGAVAEQHARTAPRVPLRALPIEAVVRSPSWSTTVTRSSPSGRASSTRRTASRSTSVPRRWPVISAISPAVRCSPAPVG